MLHSNTVAIITGGARGIGRAMALRFAEEGCKIVIADLRKGEAEETFRRISERNSEGIFVRCDVTKYSQIQEMLRQALDRFHQIDIMVNNAAASPPERSFIEMTEEEWAGLSMSI